MRAPVARTNWRRLHVVLTLALLAGVLLLGYAIWEMGDAITSLTAAHKRTGIVPRGTVHKELM